MFSDEHIEKYVPKVDFNYQDNLLAYFNAKESIPKTCSDSLFCFYEISHGLTGKEVISRAHCKCELESEEPSETDEEPYFSESEEINDLPNLSKSEEEI